MVSGVRANRAMINGRRRAIAVNPAALLGSTISNRESGYDRSASLATVKIHYPGCILTIQEAIAGAILRSNCDSLSFEIQCSRNKYVPSPHDDRVSRYGGINSLLYGRVGIRDVDDGAEGIHGEQAD